MSILQKFCDETGELLTYSINEETGELCLKDDSETSFVPPSNTQERQFPYDYKFNSVFRCNSKKYQCLKANIIAGSNKISYRMLLLPTSVLCPPLLCILLMLIEIFLHIQCHKKNKLLEDPTLYYRSPFHAVTSVFCGVCRESDTACKVGKIQDKRRLLKQNRSDVR